MFSKCSCNKLISTVKIIKCIIFTQVLFVNSEAEGCGGIINVTNSLSFRTQKSEFYDALQDCHWIVISSATKQLQFTINSIDLKNKISNTTYFEESCTGDYLEVLDKNIKFF